MIYPKNNYLPNVYKFYKTSKNIKTLNRIISLCNITMCRTIDHALLSSDVKFVICNFA